MESVRMSCTLLFRMPDTTLSFILSTTQTLKLHALASEHPLPFSRQLICFGPPLHTFLMQLNAGVPMMEEVDV